VNPSPTDSAGSAGRDDQTVWRELLRQAGRIWCGSLVMLLFLIPAIAGSGVVQWALDQWLPPAASLLVTILTVSAPLTALGMAAAICLGERMFYRGRRPLQRSSTEPDRAM
jgi:membrane protease YdiL (CAAX protease family)